ncbi:unnamed protein product [Rhizophagus irregularis]|nr:unnamed protein product [Rhizophagus irregularis]
MNRLGRRDKIDERFRQLRDADGLLRDNRELRIKLRQLDTENSHLREREYYSKNYYWEISNLVLKHEYNILYIDNKYYSSKIQSGKHGFNLS